MRTLYPFSIYPYATYKTILLCIACILLYSTMVYTVRTKKTYALVVYSVVGIGFFVAVWGICQHLMHTKYLYGLPCFSREEYHFFGPYLNRNHFAGFIAMCGVFTVGVAVAQYINRRAFVLILFCAGVMAFSLLLCGSFGGLISFLGGLMGIYFLLSKREYVQKIFLLFFFILIGILTFLVLFLKIDVEKITLLRSAHECLPLVKRLMVWQDISKYIGLFPFFGTGVGTFAVIFPHFQQASLTGQWLYAHNDYLQWCSETGIIGGICLGIVGILLLQSIMKLRGLVPTVSQRGIIQRPGSIQALKRTQFYGSECQKGTVPLGESPYQDTIAVGAWCAVLTLLFHGLCDFNFHIPANVMMMTLFCAIGIIRVKEIKEMSVHKTDWSSIKIRVVGTLVCVGVLIYVWGIITTVGTEWVLNRISSTRVEQYSLKDRIFVNRVYTVLTGISSWNAQTHYQYAQFLCHSQKQYQNALKQYEEAIGRNPFDAWYYISYALCIYEARLHGVYVTTHREAREAFRQALICRPQDASLYFIYASYLGRIGDRNEAAIYFKKAVMLNPEYRDKVMEVWFSYEPTYKGLMHVLPDTSDFHYEAILFLIKKGHWRENEADFREEYARAKDFYHSTGLVEGYLSEGKIREAIEVLQDFLNGNPRDARIHVRIAEILIKDDAKKHDMRIRQHFMAAIHEKPLDPFYRYWYAVYLYRTGNYEDAFLQFHTVQKRDSKYTARIEHFLKTKSKEAEGPK